MSTWMNKKLAGIRYISEGRSLNHEPECGPHATGRRNDRGMDMEEPKRNHPRETTYYFVRDVTTLSGCNVEYVNVGTFSDLDPFKDSGEDDILMLCSGRFETQNLAPSNKTTTNDDPPDSPKESNQIASARKKKRVLIESDDEEDGDLGIEAEETSKDTSEAPEPTLMEEEHDVPKQATLHRTVVLSDSEESLQSDPEMDQKEGNVCDGKGGSGDEKVGDVEEEEGDDDDGDAEQEAGSDDGDLEEEVQNGEDDVKRANDYIDEEADSDDELAVVRRLEKSEFERKANREKWFDDEASLSGDDVGSDLDDDGDVANEYEAEEGPLNIRFLFLIF
ncbi:hypothetical protein COOONC_02197 [Cooperia oncophora]